MQGERNSACTTHESRLPLILSLMVCVLVWCVSSLGSEGEDNNDKNNNNNNNSIRNDKNKIKSNKNNDKSTTTEVDDPFCSTPTTRALVSSRQSSNNNNHNHIHNHHFLTRPITLAASSPPFISPQNLLVPSIFPLSDQEHENMMLELVWELLQLDHLTASSTTTSSTYAQGDDDNNSEYVQDRTQLTPTALLLLRHVDEQPPMIPQNTMGSRPFIRSCSKMKECGGRALEEALGLHMLGMEEVWGKVIHVNNNNSNSEAEHHTCLEDSASAAHEQIKKQDSSVAEANDLRCRKVEEGQVLSAARQR